MPHLDTIFELLSEERRRYVLYYLEEQGTEVPVDELVAKVADWESDESKDEIPPEKFREVKISLEHTDLPKTADVEFIKYDAEDDMVQINGTSMEFDAVINLAKVIEEPRSD